jgi:hypothetical protein
MLRAVSPMEPDPRSTTRPVNETFDFVVTLVDRKAERKSQRTLELSLAAENDLFFPGGSKTVTQVESIGDTPVEVTLDRKKIIGPGKDLSSFRVTLREEGSDADLVFCMIGLDG